MNHLSSSWDCPKQYILFLMTEVFQEEMTLEVSTHPHGPLPYHKSTPGKKRLRWVYPGLSFMGQRFLSLARSFINKICCNRRHKHDPMEWVCLYLVIGKLVWHFLSFNSFEPIVSQWQRPFCRFSHHSNQSVEQNTDLVLRTLVEALPCCLSCALWQLWERRDRIVYIFLCACEYKFLFTLVWCASVSFFW